MIKEDYSDLINIIIDDIIRLTYDIKINKLIIKTIDINRSWITIEQVLSDNDDKFISTLVKNINKVFEEVTDEEYKDYIIEFNNGIITLVKNSFYNPRIAFEDIIEDNIWNIIIICKTKEEIIEILKGLTLIYNHIKDTFEVSNNEYNERIRKEKEDFERVRDYGLKFEYSYTDIENKYLYTFDKGIKVYKDEPIYTIQHIDLYRTNLKNTALSIISNDDCKALTLFYPKRLFPISHKEDYSNSDNLYKDNNTGIMKTYADLTLERYSSKLLEYIFPLVLCKKLHINKVFDIGCGTGIQSWLFNQNNIIYTGIDKDSINIFPFRCNESLISFYNLEFPEIYKVKDNTLRNNYKNSLAILFYSYNMINSNYDIKQEELRLLLRYHPYILISSDMYDPDMINKNEVVQKYCEKVYTFGILNTLINNPNRKIYSNGYILLIRKGSKYVVIN